MIPDAGKLPSDDVSLDGLMLPRLRMAGWAILASLPIPLAYATLFRPAPLAAASIAMAMLSASVVLIFTTRRRIPARLAGTLVFALWALVLTAVLASYLAYDDRGYAFLVAMLFLSQAAVQLRASWLTAAYLVGGLAWIVVGPLDADGTRFIDVLAWLGASALGFLVFAANRHVLLRLERMRVVAVENSRALTEALNAARREIVERELAENERDLLRQQFVAAQKMEAVGRLAGGLAHDMNNLLAGILSMAEFCRENGSQDLRADLDEIIASCVRGGQLTRQLLGFSRRHRAASELVEMDGVMSQVAGILTRTLPKRIRLETELGGDLLVEGDAAQLSQAILNICLNGIDAMPGAGVLAMVARDRTLDASSAMKLRLAPGMYVEIAVRDSGSGMDALTSARIFEPFFTTKAGRGTGLGLAMVYGTVKAHRGAIEVESEPGRGTLIRILLPRGDRKGRRTEIPPSNLPLPTRRTGRILVVDDDPLLRSTTKRMLERAGHEVLVAEDGKEALEIFEKTPEIGGILLDMSMPHMGGADCFQALRARDPAVKVVLMSGFARSEEVRASLATGALGFVGKPFSAARLHEAVAALLQGVRLSPEDDGGEDPLT